jgi:hypothetical protein
MRPFGTSSTTVWHNFPFAINRPDLPFSKRFSRQSKVYAVRGDRGRVPGHSGSSIPLRWMQESRDASPGSGYRCGHIQFNPFRGEEIEFDDESRWGVPYAILK